MFTKLKTFILEQEQKKSFINNNILHNKSGHA